MSFGESDEHNEAKTMLQSHVGTYAFLVSKCGGCALHDCWEHGDDAVVELERSCRIDSRRYVYDAVMKRGSESIVMEVWHTHETGVTKISDTRAHGLQFAEFCTTDVMRLAAVAPRLAGENRQWIILNNLKPLIVSCATCTVQRVACEGREAAVRHAAAHHASNEVAVTACTWNQVVRREQEMHEVYCREYDKLPCIIAIKEKRIKQKEEAQRELQGLKYMIHRSRCSAWREEGHRRAMEAGSKVQHPEKYSPGMKKCSACCKWTDASRMHAIGQDKFSRDEYIALNKWYWDNDKNLPLQVLVCAACTVSCARCDKSFCSTHAIKYGMCFPCNKKCMRTQQ